MNVFLPGKIKNEVFINRFTIGSLLFTAIPQLPFTGRKLYQKEHPDEQQKYPVFRGFRQIFATQKNNIADSFIYLPQKTWIA